MQARLAAAEAEGKAAAQKLTNAGMAKIRTEGYNAGHAAGYNKALLEYDEPLANARIQGYHTGHTKGFSEGAASKNLLTHAHAKKLITDAQVKMKTSMEQQVRAFNVTVKVDIENRLTAVRKEEHEKANLRVDNARNGGFQSGLQEALLPEGQCILVEEARKEGFEAGKAAAAAAAMQDVPNTKDAPVVID
jgi:hypothetical protein